MNTMKIYAAIVAEGEIDGVRTFSSREELDAFDSGFTAGASMYGGGWFGVYTEDDEFADDEDDDDEDDDDFADEEDEDEDEDEGNGKGNLRERVCAAIAARRAQDEREEAVASQIRDREPT